MNDEEHDRVMRHMIKASCELAPLFKRYGVITISSPTNKYFDDLYRESV